MTIIITKVKRKRLKQEQSQNMSVGASIEVWGNYPHLTTFFFQSDDNTLALNQRITRALLDVVTSVSKTNCPVPSSLSRHGSTLSELSQDYQPSFLCYTALLAHGFAKIMQFVPDEQEAVGLSECGRPTLGHFSSP